MNRVVRITPNGWELEADQRHVDIILDQLNLSGANGVRTPWEDEKKHEEEENQRPLEGADARRYRELAARANYLAQDRADIQFATKEVCRGMCRPTKGDLKKLRRLARYLISVPRVVLKYTYQDRQQNICGYSDSDFAGCRITAKSTSGGVIMNGGHYLKSWSSTQKTVALSTGEAELTALVKCSCELIGMTQLASDWGIDLQGDVMVDSSAAIGVVKRKGAGKLSVGQLWIQEKAENEELRYHKVKGSENPADMLTKGLNWSDITKYMNDMKQEVRTARAEKGLDMATGVR